jgi:hypothetical protein
VPLDPVANPYTPRAGHPPAHLAGRDGALDAFDVVLDRVEAGRPAAAPLLGGLRGTGTSVLLGTFARRAADRGWVVGEADLAPGADLSAVLARLATRAAVQLAPGAPAVPGVPPEDLEESLTTLGTAARTASRGVVLALDDLHTTDRAQLGGLLAALAQVARRGLPLVVTAGGLPSVTAQVAAAGPAAAGVFAPVEVGPLSDLDAARALARPALAEGVRFARSALAAAVDASRGVPVLVQVLGDQVWRTADQPEITAEDVERAVPLALEALDRDFFGVRADLLPLAQRRYLRAMAEFGPGEVASGDVAALLGMRSSSQAGQIREALLRKGLIHSPRLGHAAFTAALFDEHLVRWVELERHEPQRRAPS